MRPLPLLLYTLALALVGCSAASGSRSTTPGDAVSIEGYLDLTRSGVGYLDGEQVVLRPGAVIEGGEQWTGQTYASFDEVAEGAWVEVQGLRGADGRVVAASALAEPNGYTRMDSLVHTALASGLSVPPPSQLSGGRVEIGGMRFQLVENREIQTYVTRIGYRLVPRYAQLADPDAPGVPLFRFYVIEDSTFNAFAFPDGSVFVHTGLLRALENEAQLAAVLGHEIAHATYEHSRKRFAREQRRRILSRVAVDAASITGADRTAVGALVFGTGVLSNVYSRGDEDQADRVGLHYMVEAGYDPREAIRVWERIAEVTDRGGVAGAAQDLETFLYSSHSAANTRAEHLRELIGLYHAGAAGETNEDAFRELLRRLL